MNDLEPLLTLLDRLCPERNGAGRQHQAATLLAAREFTPTNLARNLHCSNSQATRLLAEMEDHGLVKRTYSQTDRRSVTVRLTPTGHDWLQNYNQHRLDKLRTALEQLPTKIRDSLLRIAQEKP